ncbi:MAG TPA: hypothetical protein VNB29_08480 [Chthoniobacterales bacterium]|nr:hypothetical protein [Chthoniobacterales bacterium]
MQLIGNDEEARKPIKSLGRETFVKWEGEAPVEPTFIQDATV